MPPKRLYTNHHIFFLIRLTVLPALGPEPTRRGSIRGGVASNFLHISRSCCCFSSRSRCCSALALGPLPGLLLLLLLLALLLSLLLLLAMLLQFSYTSVD